MPENPLSRSARYSALCVSLAAFLGSACSASIPHSAKTTVMSFPDLDCSDCGEEMARSLIREDGVYKTSFDKHRVELVVVADPSVDAFGLALKAKPAKEDWHLVLGSGLGRYLPWAEAPLGADVQQISKNGEDIADLKSHLVLGKVTIVDFSAKWCAPCRELDEHVMGLVSKRTDVAYRKLDVGDWDTPLGTHYLKGVKELPYVIVFDKHGLEVEALSGLDVGRFDKVVARAAAQ